MGRCLSCVLGMWEVVVAGWGCFEEHLVGLLLQVLIWVTRDGFFSAFHAAFYTKTSLLPCKKRWQEEWQNFQVWCLDHDHKASGSTLAWDMWLPTCHGESKLQELRPHARVKEVESKVERWLIFFACFFPIPQTHCLDLGICTGEMHQCCSCRRCPAGMSWWVSQESKTEEAPWKRVHEEKASDYHIIIMSPSVEVQPVLGCFCRIRRW